MNQQTQARNLYFQTDMKQADIAALIGISDKTLYRWITQNGWKQMKEAARQAPLAIVEMLYKQLYALNKSICNREDPIPTLQEAETNRKLINSIDKLKKQASLSENIQVLMGFTSFLNSIDNDLAKTVVLHADHYLKEKGHTTLGFYEEPEEEPTETNPDDVEQPQSENVPQHEAKEAVIIELEPEQIAKPQPLSTATDIYKAKKAVHANKLQRLKKKQLSQHEQQRLIAQQQIRNSFYAEMERSANTQNRHRQ